MNVGVTSPKILIRKGLCALLSGLDGVSSVLDLSSPLDEPQSLRDAALDVLVVDMADTSTDFEALCYLHTLLPQTRVLVLTDDADEELQFQAIRNGARGFVSRNCAPEVLERALKGVARGEMWIGHGVATRIIGKLLQNEADADSGQPALSRREQEILALVAEGYRNKEIAAILAVSENTIRAHVASLYRKIQVSGRVEAALYYFGRRRRNGHSKLLESHPDPMTRQEAAVSAARSVASSIRNAADITSSTAPRRVLPS